MVHNGVGVCGLSIIFLVRFSCVSRAFLVRLVGLKYGTRLRVHGVASGGQGVVVVRQGNVRCASGDQYIQRSEM